MEDFEYTEYERKAKIQNVIHKYGEENFAMSYSGGKDSNIMHVLFDLALPGNKIPRVYVNTGIELNAVSNFVKEKAKTDSRIHIIQPQRNIREVLETHGYPFKSKEHSKQVYYYQKEGPQGHIFRYVQSVTKTGEKHKYGCPKKLLYQFSPEFKLKISDKCCEYMKERPLHEWQKRMNFRISIIGLRRSENGRRKHAQCLAFENNQLKAFQPLAPISLEFEEYLIKKYNIQLPIVYGEPYNFTRTGCKGCPFAVDLENELDILEQYFPAERNQCEIIWKPVYDEYRRIGYRLKSK